MKKPSNGPWNKGTPYQEGVYQRTPIQLGSDDENDSDIAFICGPNQSANADLIAQIPELVELLRQAFLRLCGVSNALTRAGVPDVRYDDFVEEVRKALLQVHI